MTRSEEESRHHQGGKPEKSGLESENLEAQSNHGEKKKRRVVTSKDKEYTMVGGSS